MVEPVVERMRQVATVSPTRGLEGGELDPLHHQVLEGDLEVLDELRPVDDAADDGPELAGLLVVEREDVRLVVRVVSSGRSPASRPGGRPTRPSPRARCAG